MKRLLLGLAILGVLVPLAIYERRSDTGARLRVKWQSQNGEVLAAMIENRGRVALLSPRVLHIEQVVPEYQAGMYVGRRQYFLDRPFGNRPEEPLAPGQTCLDLSIWPARLEWVRAVTAEATLPDGHRVTIPCDTEIDPYGYLHR